MSHLTVPIQAAFCCTEALMCTGNKQQQQQQHKPEEDLFEVYQDKVKGKKTGANAKAAKGTAIAGLPGTGAAKQTKSKAGSIGISMLCGVMVQALSLFKAVLDDVALSLSLLSSSFIIYLRC